MDGDAVVEVRDLAQQAAEVHDIAGGTFSAVPMHQVHPEQPEPDPLVVHTLDGLVDYLTENQDDLEPDAKVPAAAVHVVSPHEVRVVSSLVPRSHQRFVYARATYEPRVDHDRGSEVGLRFGKFYPTEDANIALQALFEDAGDRADVLHLLGNVRNQEVRTEQDDGVTQTVTAESKLGLEREEVPNPVELAPHRTFPEIDQPLSPFVLRMRKTPEGVGAALFEADGGAWRLEAIDRIASYLEGRVEFPVFS